MEMKEVIQRIGYFRNKLNLSARELSLRLGKHDGYINKLESKDFNLPTQMLLEIIEVLEITPAEFFADNYADYKKNKEILELIENMPSEKKSGLIAFIKK